ncbi:metallophosphoesterase family protein [Roseovarius sp. D22-M7]|uniref:metallophosphoesterase family protein n=1 Tax=Roseovarius sp. D22-M7 TaxID=3127116 RepID=UPI00300FDACC
MTGACTRRSLLKSLGAASTLIASPALARTSWRIRGSGRGVLRLVFYTDIHASADPRRSDAVTMAAGAINAQKADLVLCGGDLIHGGFDARPDDVAARWDAYTSMARAIGAEHHAVVGNHDLVGAQPGDGSEPAPDPRLEFKRHLGVSRTFDTFDALGYRFVLLDSLRISDAPHMYDGWVSSEQREWIREVLSGTPSDQPIVVLLHMPLLTAFFAATKGATFQAQPNRVVINNTEVLGLFADHNLVLVLQGHLHVSEAVQWRGTTFLTGGAICGNWWRGSFFDTAEGFSAITLRDDRIEWEYIDYGWTAPRHEE